VALAAHRAPAKLSRDLLSSFEVRCRCARRIGSAASATPQTSACGKIAVGPGGGVCGAVARTKRRSDNIRAVAVVPALRCAAFRHVGARRVSPGPPLRPAGCRARLNRRTNAAVASLGAARRVGDPAPVGRPAAAVASLPAARSAWPGARERPRGSASLAQPRGHRPSRPAGTPPRTPPLCSSSCRLPRRVADRSGVRRSWCPRLKLRCAARRFAPCPTPRDLRSAPASLHCEREPPLAALASCAA